MFRNLVYLGLQMCKTLVSKLKSSVNFSRNVIPFVTFKGINTHLCF